VEKRAKKIAAAESESESVAIIICEEKALDGHESQRVYSCL
jgi:hypothetical protein